MSDIYGSPSRDFGDTVQLTNWILNSVTMWHMTPQVSNFISGSLEDTNKYIEVADGNHVMAQKKGQSRIKMCDDNGDTLITTLHNVLLATGLCGRLFYIIMLINLGHTCLFNKEFYRV